MYHWRAELKQMEKHTQTLGSGLTRLESGLEDYPDGESCERWNWRKQLRPEMRNQSQKEEKNNKGKPRKVQQLRVLCGPGMYL